MLAIGIGSIFLGIILMLGNIKTPLPQDILSTIGMIVFFVGIILTVLEIRNK